MSPEFLLCSFDEDLARNDSTILPKLLSECNSACDCVESQFKAIICTFFSGRVFHSEFTYQTANSNQSVFLTRTAEKLYALYKKAIDASWGSFFSPSHTLGLSPKFRFRSISFFNLQLFFRWLLRNSLFLMGLMRRWIPSGVRGTARWAPNLLLLSLLRGLPRQIWTS